MADKKVSYKWHLKVLNELDRQHGKEIKILKEDRDNIIKTGFKEYTKILIEKKKLKTQLKEKDGEIKELEGLLGKISNPIQENIIRKLKRKLKSEQKERERSHR